MIRKLKVDSRPLYAQTVEALYALLDEGTFKVGQLLPSTEILAQQLGVSRSTLREAISYLEMDGLVVRRQGVGTYVAATPRDQVRGGLERLRSFRVLGQLAGRQVETIRKQVSKTLAGEREATALDVTIGAELIRVQVVEAIDGCRIAYLDSRVLPDEVDVATLDATEGSLLDYLIDFTELPLAFTHSEIYALDADADLASLLDIEVGRSVLHLAETWYTEMGQPVGISLNYFLTDCFIFSITRRIDRAGGRARN